MVSSESTKNDKRDTMLKRFNTKKAVQAAAALLRQEPDRRMSRLRLLKLLYIADRESIKKTGRPIIGSRFVAMDNGPLHSAVYDLIKGQHAHEQDWSAHFRNAPRYNVELYDDPGVSELSKYELEILEKVVKDHLAMEDWDVAVSTHEFDEWRKNYEKGTSKTIPVEHVIEAVGRGDDKDDIIQDMKDSEAFANLFGG